MLGGLLPQRVFAGDLQNQAQKEAKVYTALKAIRFQCVQQGDSLRFAPEFEKQSSFDITYSAFYYYKSAGQMAVAVGEHVDSGDGKISCVDQSEMAPVVKLLGFDSVRDFFNFFVKEDGGNFVDRYGTNSGQKFFDYVNSKAEKGPDNNINALSKAGKYWLIETNLRKGGCKPGPYDNATSAYHKKVGIVTDKGEYKEVEWSVTDDHNVNVGRGILNKDGREDDTGISCSDLLDMLADKSLAKAYAELAEQDLKNGQPVSSNTGATGNPEDNSNATCKASGPLEWILCPIFNLFAEATEFFYKQILQPFLYTPPVDTDPASGSFKAWSGFRLYGNIILVIAMIVIVFGQSIGGGLVDAYTAKKVLPRILAAAILVNLSVYIVAILVDLTNILGRGVSNLIMAPFGDLTAGLSGSAQGGVIGLAALGAFLSTGAVAGFVATIAGVGGIGVAASFIGFTIVLPALIAIIGVFVTLVIRRGIILALILVSPIAFALYCLPNTEQYFRKWWDLLFKSLLVYPIVMLIFAISNVMSLTILDVNSSNSAGGIASSGIAGIIAFALQIIPLFLVPFAFKFSGGAIGSLYGAIQGGGGKLGNAFKSRREQSQKDYSDRSVYGREQAARRLKKEASNQNRSALTRRTARFMQNRVGGYNIAAAASAARAERMKIMNDQIATGDDDEIRALTVDARMVKASRKGVAALEAAGYKRDKDFTLDDETGALKLRNASGKFYDAGTAQVAQDRWGGDQSAVQKALSYEIQKSIRGDQHDSVVNSIVGIGKGQGFSDNEMNMIVKGAGFEQQNKTKEYKHMGVEDGKLKLAGGAFADEMAATFGTYQAFSQDADTYSTLGNVYMEAIHNPSAEGAQVTQEQIEKFASQFRGMSGEDMENYLARAAAASADEAQRMGLPAPLQSAPADVRKSIESLLSTIDKKSAQGTVALQDSARRDGNGNRTLNIDLKRG